MAMIATGTALVLLCALGSAAPALAQDLRARMEQALAEEGLVGAVWATIDADGTVATGAAGLSHAAEGRILAAGDRIQIGSVTKTLVATGVLRLVSAGRLSLDARLQDLLPGIRVENSWDSTHPLRLRHLLDHTAGLDDARLHDAFSLEATPDTPLLAIVGNGRPLRVRHPPGLRFSYSNLGFTLLGLVIEVATGDRYESWLDANLLGPLGMTGSTFEFVSQTGPDGDPLLAMGHFERGAVQVAVPSFLRPAGQFTTTAADMARFARFLLSDGTVDGQPFVRPDLLRAMGRPSGTEAAAAGLVAGYGLGLGRRDRHGVVGLCHAGNTVGYRAMLCLFPAEHKAFFVSHNADSETADYGRFDAILIDALGVAPAEPPAAAGFPAGLAAWTGYYVPEPNRFASFAYLDRLTRFVEVEFDGNELRIDPFQGPARALIPSGGMLFRAADRATTSHGFLQASDGQRVVTDGLQSYRQIAAWRLGMLWTSFALGGLGLLGLLATGVVRLVRRSLAPSQPLFLPLLAVAGLALPLPFFFSQSFLALGDLTVASALLAFVTGFLPIAMIAGLWRRPSRPESWAMIAVLQWCLVLAAWGLLPLRLWA